MATKMADRELRELREKVRKTEAEFTALPKWTQAYQAKGELLLAYKQQLTAAEEAQSDILVTPPKLDFTRGNVQSELAAIDRRLELIGDGPLENEVYIAHRQELNARKEEITFRLPYAEMNDDDLTRQMEDQAVELEQLQARARALGPLKGDWADSAEAKQVHRLANEAAGAKVRLEQEQRYRFEHRNAQQAVVTLAQDQAKELATEAWRKSLETQMAEMEANGAPKWEVQKIREESGGSPPEEMVEQFAADIKADWIERHPVADPNVSI